VPPLRLGGVPVLNRVGHGWLLFLHTRDRGSGWGSLLHRPPPPLAGGVMHATLHAAGLLSVLAPAACLKLGASGPVGPCGARHQLGHRSSACQGGTGSQQAGRTGRGRGVPASRTGTHTAGCRARSAAGSVQPPTHQVCS
jgi:hypothetical protein